MTLNNIRARESMKSTLTSQQPNFDGLLEQLEYNRALILRLTDKKEEFGENELVIQREIRLRCDELQQKLDNIERLIIGHKEALENSPQFNEIGKDDLNFNLIKLKQRQQDYKALYQNSELQKIKTDNDEYYPVQHWELELQDNKKIPPFIPRETRQICTHKAENKLNGKATHITSNRKVDYSIANFVYADDDSALDNRYVWYWEEEKNHYAETGEASWVPTNPNVAITNSFGFAQPISVISYHLMMEKNEETKEGRLRLAKILSIQAFMMEREGEKNHARYGISSSPIKLTTKARFFVYPLDESPFLSKSMETLSSIKKEEANNASSGDCIESVVAFGVSPDDIDTRKYRYQEYLYNGKIAVHCTLPEWNHRLRKVLSIVQRQINEYNLVLSAFYVRLSALNEMIDLLKLQTEYPFKGVEKMDWTALALSGIKMKVLGMTWDVFFRNEDKERILEAEDRESLYKALVALRNAMMETMENPESAGSQLHNALAREKENVNRSCDQLWDLINSSALKSELQRYVECAKAAINDESQHEKIKNGFAPGPYMVEEGNWALIFNTIAECYAALSSSSKHKQKLFDEVVSPSLDSLLSIDPEHELYKQFDSVWGSTAVLTIEQAENGAVNDNSYIKEQVKSVSRLKKVRKNQTNLLDVIFSEEILTTFETIWNLKGVIVPGPGTPCVLQVILSCFQKEIFSELYKKIKGDAAYHLRFFNSVSRVFRVLEVTKGKSRASDLSDIFRSFVVTQNKQSNQERRISAGKRLKRYSENLANGNGDVSDSFYKHFDGRQSKYNLFAFAKVLYVYYNLTTNIQTALSLEDQAKEKGWDSNRVQLELMKSTLTVTSDTLSMAKSIAVVIERLKVTTIGKGNFDFSIKLLGSSLDHLAKILTVATLITTAIAINEYDPADGDALLMASTASLIADSLLLYGWMASSGVLVVVGTAITVLVIAVELVQMYQLANSAEAQKRLLTLWSQFKEGFERDKVTALINSSEVVTTLRDYRSGTPLELDVDEHYDTSKDELIKVLHSSPFEQLNFCQKTKKEVVIVADKLSESIWEQFTNKGYVELGGLSWRAVIPMYLLGYQKAHIESLVTFDTRLDEFSGIKNIYDIINYYEQVKSINIDLENNKESAFISILNSNAENQFDRIHVATLLEQGVFIPPNKEDQRFFLDSVWQHETYRIPKLKSEGFK
jgi:hypothetical protein